MKTFKYPSSLSEEILKKNFSEKEIEKAFAKVEDLEEDNPEYIIEDVIYFGETLAQSRPRTRVIPRGRKSFAVIYEEPKITDFKKTFKEFVVNEIFERVGNHLAYFPAHGPFHIHIKVFKAMPKNWPKANKILGECGIYRPESKPDFDNLAKSICDAINTKIYADDGQIVHATVDKYFSDTPRVELTIKFRIKELYKK